MKLDGARAQVEPRIFKSKVRKNPKKKIESGNMQSGRKSQVVNKTCSSVPLPNRNIQVASTSCTVLDSSNRYRCVMSLDERRVNDRAMQTVRNSDATSFGIQKADIHI